MEGTKSADSCPAPCHPPRLEWLKMIMASSTMKLGSAQLLLHRQEGDGLM